AEIDFDTLARTYLHKVTDYETFSEQVINLLDDVDAAAVERIRYKATPQFVDDLDAWIATLADEAFAPCDIVQKNTRLSTQWVCDAFAESPFMPIFARLNRVADRAVHTLKNAVRDRGGKW